MRKTTGDHLKDKGLEDQIHGVAPQKSIDMTSYAGTDIPAEWDIVGVTGDILMVEYVDTDGEHEEIVRNGIIIPKAMQHKVWRVGQIMKAGPGASEQAVEGSFIMFPNDKGIPLSKFGGKNYIFINEERIFAFVEPKK